MMSRKHLRWPPVAAVAAVALVVGVSAAFGNANQDVRQPNDVSSYVSAQALNEPHAAVLAAFSVFSEPSNTGKTSAAEQETLREALGGGDSVVRGAIATADFSFASSAPVQGTAQRAWIVPSGDQVCLVLPDAGGGFAYTCQTLEAIREGKGLLTLTPRPESGDTTAVVAVIVPDGGSAPSLGNAGSYEAIKIVDNVAASVATTSDELRTAAGTVSLAPTQ